MRLLVPRQNPMCPTGKQNHCSVNALVGGPSADGPNREKVRHAVGGTDGGTHDMTSQPSRGTKHGVQDRPRCVPVNSLSSCIVQAAWELYILSYVCATGVSTPELRSSMPPRGSFHLHVTIPDTLEGGTGRGSCLAVFLFPLSFSLVFPSPAWGNGRA